MKLGTNFCSTRKKYCGREGNNITSACAVTYTVIGAANVYKNVHCRKNDIQSLKVKMSELKIQAPLARIEDWPEFNDFQNSEDFENSNKDSFSSPETNENSFVDSSFSDAFSTSLEDLVNTFDEKITKCFYNYEENVEQLAPVQVRTQDEIMNECQ